MKANRTHGAHRAKPPRPPTDATASRPRVVTVPGLIERGHEVIRDEDDSDADYERSQELFALVIEAAKTP